MSLKFDGETTYILPLTNKHGLSRYEPSKILTEDSFSFCCRIQVDWDNIDPERAGGVIAFNGMHTGIMVRHPSKDDYFIQADVWVEEDGIAKPKQVFYKVPLDKKDGWIDVVLSIDQKKNKIALRVDEGGNVGWISHVIEYEGELVDYTNCLLWIGACNALKSCPQEHRWYFTGKIQKIGFFTHYLSPRHSADFFKENLLEFNDTLVSHSDMKKTTRFKVFDKSGNGNHLIKYSDEWM